MADRGDYLTRLCGLADAFEGPNQNVKVAGKRHRVRRTGTAIFEKPARSYRRVATMSRYSLSLSAVPFVALLCSLIRAAISLSRVAAASIDEC